jgi:predicted DNA-binding transcriptional regulator YafY
MDPATLIAGAIAIVFALLAMLQWRRASDLEERVRELEGKLADALPAPRELAPAVSAAPVSAPVVTPEPEPPTLPPEPDEPEGLEALPTEAPMPELEPIDPADDPASARAPAASSASNDSMRLAALEVVAQAFELARYLDFDFIVEKPSTYRVTVPITAANGNAVRYLEAGMFTCLKAIRIEDGKAILHIDTAKGPP